MTFTTGNFHDKKLLEKASNFLSKSNTNKDSLQYLLNLENKHIEYIDNQCVNLIAAESPTSPLVQKCLSSKLGYRASGGHIGKTSRCFPGMNFIDEIESICIELLKKIFCSNFSDHRLMGGLSASNIAYISLIKPSDMVMTLSQSNGGDSSNLIDGPISLRGGKIMYIPYDKEKLSIDLENFFDISFHYKPKVVAIGEATTLFEHPISEISSFVSQWGGKVFFDGAHQAGLIAGGVYRNPLSEGATILTGSGGKTFSGPQSGMIMWNDESITEDITHNIFPVFTGSHQINRVFAMAVSCLEIIEYGNRYMNQVLENAKIFATELDNLGLHVLGKEKGFTNTHQILVDISEFGTGYDISQKLSQANIRVNKMLIPYDSDTNNAIPHGIRMGVTELTRYGVTKEDLKSIAQLIYETIKCNNVKKTSSIKKKIISLRKNYNKLYYCFDNGLP